MQLHLNSKLLVYIVHVSRKANAHATRKGLFAPSYTIQGKSMGHAYARKTCWQSCHQCLTGCIVSTLGDRRNQIQRLAPHTPLLLCRRCNISSFRLGIVQHRHRRRRRGCSQQEDLGSRHQGCHLQCRCNYPKCVRVCLHVCSCSRSERSSQVMVNLAVVAATVGRVLEYMYA